MIPRLAKLQQKESGSKHQKNMKQKNAKKAKKSKRKETSYSSSSACSSSESSSSSSDTSDESYSSASTSTSSISDSERNIRITRKGGRAGKKLDLDLLEMLWPNEDRPKQLQEKSVIYGKPMSTMLRMKDQYAKEIEKNAKKTKKSKRKETSSSSSSDTADESSSIASTSTSSSSESERNARMTRKGGRAGKNLDLDLLEMLWPKEDRPKQLQEKSVIEGKSMSTMLRMKDQCAKDSIRCLCAVASMGPNCAKDWHLGQWLQSARMPGTWCWHMFAPHT